MSYILDALRKSEQERRQSEPVVLVQAPSEAIELPRRPVAPWLGAAAVIVVALIAAYWLFSGRQPGPGGAAPPAVASAGPTASPEPAATPRVAPPPADAPRPAAAALAAPELKPHPLVTQGTTSVRDLAAEAQVERRKPKSPAAPAPWGNAVASAAPIPAAAAVPDPVKFLRVMPPEFQRQLPELVVNIHIYAPRAADRILYVNNRQYHAGDRVRDDVIVEEIVEDGAVLSFRGQRFKLPRPS